MRRLAAAVCLLLAGPVWAAEIADFNSQYANAWSQFRDAFYQSAPTHADPAATQVALGAFTPAWDRLMARWSAKPPPQFAEDPNFGRELKAVAEVTAHAARQAHDGRLDQAHATLGEVRALLAELRRRNGLESYTDQLDAFDEKLAEAADDELDHAELTPAQFVQLCEQVGVLTYLAERLEKRAPPQLAEDANFLDMAEGIARQVRALKAAVLDGQRAPVLAALADLRQNFDRLYLLYG